MELQDWRAVGASVIGTSHAKSGVPCQDSHYVGILGVQDPVVVLIASDGAGSASRSEHGSALACHEVMVNVRLFLEDGGRLADVTKDVAASWLENAAMAIQEMADREGLAVREFACTLLVALVSQLHTVCMQIGDGAIVFSPRGDDGWCLMSWPQHGEYINTTVFLTDPDARAGFEFCSRPDVVDEIAVFTDGIEALVLHYATQSVHGPFFDSVFPAVRSLVDSGVDRALSDKLGAYLSSASICERTDDDKTLLLASRVKRPASRALAVVDESYR